MSIKKISKEQPENFEFNSKNLEVAKKLSRIIQKANSKALLWHYYFLHKDKTKIGYL